MEAVQSSTSPSLSGCGGLSRGSRGGRAPRGAFAALAADDLARLAEDDDVGAADVSDPPSSARRDSRGSQSLGVGRRARAAEGQGTDRDRAGSSRDAGRGIGRAWSPRLGRSGGSKRAEGEGCSRGLQTTDRRARASSGGVPAGSAAGGGAHRRADAVARPGNLRALDLILHERRRGGRRALRPRRGRGGVSRGNRGVAPAGPEAGRHRGCRRLRADRSSRRDRSGDHLPRVPNPTKPDRRLESPPRRPSAGFSDLRAGHEGIARGSIRSRRDSHWYRSLLNLP